MSRVVVQLWMVSLAMVCLLGWSAPAPAQWRVYVRPDKEEKATEGSKPPGKVEPGPQGAAKYGWGNLQKTPAAQGSGSQGWKPERPHGHVGPSKARMASPEAPKQPRGPKEPLGPKVPVASQDAVLENPDQPVGKKGFAAKPKSSSSTVSSLEEDDDDADEPEKPTVQTSRRRRPAMKSVVFPDPVGAEDKEDEEE